MGQTKCDACGQKFAADDHVIYERDVPRMTPGGDLAPDPTRRLIHYHEVGISKELWQGKFKNWPGPDAEYPKA